MDSARWMWRLRVPTWATSITSNTDILHNRQEAWWQLSHLLCRLFLSSSKGYSLLQVANFMFIIVDFKAVLVELSLLLHVVHVFLTQQENPLKTITIKALLKAQVKEILLPLCCTRLLMLSFNSASIEYGSIWEVSTSTKLDLPKAIFNFFCAHQLPLCNQISRIYQFLYLHWDNTGHMQVCRGSQLL